jgi:hypothetical protein
LITNQGAASPLPDQNQPFLGFGFGGLFSLPGPDGFPVLLGAFGRGFFFVAIFHWFFNYTYSISFSVSAINSRLEYCSLAF